MNYTAKVISLQLGMSLSFFLDFRVLVFLMVKKLIYPGFEDGPKMDSFINRISISEST